MDKKELILDTLSKFDTERDDMWTADGLPKIDVMRSLCGDSTVTRDDITLAAPAFTRKNPVVPETDDTGGDHTGEGADGNAGGTTGTEAAMPSAPVGGTAPAAGEIPQTGDDAEDTDALRAENGAWSMGEDGVLNAQVSEEDVLAFHQDRLQQMYVARDELSQMIREQEARVDSLVVKQTKSVDRQQGQHDIQAYLQAQKDKLADRAVKLQALRQIGPDLKEILSGTKGAIEQARAKRK